MTRKLFILVAVLLSLTAAPSLGQSRLGVIWDPGPMDDPTRAADQVVDLEAMREIGLSAVRLPGPSSPRIREAAADLGLTLYEDFGPRFPTVGELGSELERVVLESDGIQSSGDRLLGLAVAPPSSAPGVCEMLSQATAEIGSPTYFVSWSKYPDPCANSVDLVLYDGPSRARILADDYPAGASPDSLASSTPATGWIFGLGEDARRTDIDSLAVRLRKGDKTSIIFLHRWVDATGPGAFDAIPSPKRMGLIDGKRGLRQTGLMVQAVAAGQPSFTSTMLSEDASVPIAPRLFGWTIVILLVAMGRLSPWFLRTSRRYFRSHSIYVASVAEGRDQPSFALVAALLTAAASAALGAAYAVSAVSGTVAMELGWARSPESIQSVISWALGSWTRVIAIATVFFCLALLARAAFAMLLTRGRIRLSQTLTIVVWPFWISVMLIPVVMILATGPLPGFRGYLTGAVIWLGLAGWSSIRTSLDLARLARARALTSASIFLTSWPVLVVLTGLALLLTRPSLLSHLAWVSG